VGYQAELVGDRDTDAHFADIDGYGAHGRRLAREPQFVAFLGSQA
jgi:hypothetical protein